MDFAVEFVPDPTQRQKHSDRGKSSFSLFIPAPNDCICPPPSLQILCCTLHRRVRCSAYVSVSAALWPYVTSTEIAVMKRSVLRDRSRVPVWQRLCFATLSRYYSQRAVTAVYAIVVGSGSDGTKRGRGEDRHGKASLLPAAATSDPSTRSVAFRALSPRYSRVNLFCTLRPIVIRP